jgi:hypothetical protein
MIDVYEIVYETYKIILLMYPYIYKWVITWY